MAGVGLAVPCGRLVRSLLVGVSPADVTTLAATVGVMLAVAVTAAGLPAWRASHADPAALLRS